MALGTTPLHSMPTSAPARCSVNRPHTWWSMTMTSSTASFIFLANRPTVAEPQPMRIRDSVTPLMMGALPAWAMILIMPSLVLTPSSTCSPLASSTMVRATMKPSAPVRRLAPPTSIILEPYSSVATMPTTLPPR